MKTLLIFNDNDEDDIETLSVMLHARDMLCVIHELSEHMRTQVKWGENKYNDKQLDAIQDMREKLGELLDDYGVTHLIY